MDDREKGFIQGIAWCVAFIGVDHDQPTIAKEMMEESGYSIEDFKDAKIDGYDIGKILQM